MSRLRVRLSLVILTACSKGAPSATPAPLASSSASQESIGMAEMAADGTITLTLRATGAGMVGDGQLVYPPSHPQYAAILKHVGPIRPGEQKPVAPFP